VTERDTPADASFQQEDKSEELEVGKAKLFREMTGRLASLSQAFHILKSYSKKGIPFK
jgi:hypothetical protein